MFMDLLYNFNISILPKSLDYFGLVQILYLALFFISSCLPTGYINFEISDPEYVII